MSPFDYAMVACLVCWAWMALSLVGMARSVMAVLGHADKALRLAKEIDAELADAKAALKRCEAERDKAVANATR